MSYYTDIFQITSKVQKILRIYYTQSANPREHLLYVLSFVSSVRQMTDSRELATHQFVCITRTWPCAHNKKRDSVKSSAPVPRSSRMTKKLWEKVRTIWGGVRVRDTCAISAYDDDAWCWRVMFGQSAVSWSLGREGRPQRVGGPRRIFSHVFI